MKEKSPTTKSQSTQSDSLPNILFLFPQYAHTVTTETFESMLQWAMFAGEKGLQWNWITDPGATIISLSRSQLVSMALELEDWTHAIFIDNDMGFDPFDILKLLIEDKDIIGAQAPTKQYPLAYNAESNHLQETDTAAEVHYVGTGMMCIKREVLEHMKMHYLHDLAFAMPDGFYSEQKSMWSVDLFAPITRGAHYKNSNFYLTEDFAFCQRARDCGFEVWKHLEVKCSHTGTHVFSDDGETKMIERYARKVERIKEQNGHELSERLESKEGTAEG